MNSSGSLRGALAVAGIAAGLVIHAGTDAKAAVVDVVPTTSPITAFGTSITYAPSPATAIKASDAANTDIGDLSPSGVKTAVETLFGVSGLTLASSCEASTCVNASQTGNGDNSGSYTSVNAYTYLAVHFDNKELIFHFVGGIPGGTTFTIGGLPNGLSNWRAYSDGTLVPIPGAAGLFLTALAGLGLFARRKIAA